jgi:hypothetical protein
MHSYRQRQSSQYTELPLCGNGQSLFALKDAMVRNIKEYNDKFKARKLNPENGHRFYRTLS